MVETHEQAVKRGKKSRRDGAMFEILVRKDLEKKEWIVDRWGNNVEFIKSPNEKGEMLIEPEKTKLVKAKSNRFNMRSTGFPDFLAFKNLNKFGHFKDFRKEPPENLIVYEVIAVECKSNGTLSKEEEQKCEWYLKNKIFSKILIASKGEKRGEIVYR